MSTPRQPTPVRRAFSGLAITPGLLLVSIHVHAADITVTSALDDNGLGCTLREALFNAQRDRLTMNNCSPGSGADNIVFDNSLAGSTITLNGTELEIDSSVTIDGDIDGDGTADIAIDGNNNSRIFNTTSSSTTVSVKNLIIQNGSVSGFGSIGGGIRVSEVASFSMDNCTLINNSAESGSGGIYITKTAANISNSTITGNATVGSGGGIGLFLATVDISNSSISANQAMNGAGIYSVLTTLNINNSTLKANSATNNGIGGGIYTVSDALTLTNSTVSANTAERQGGGIIAIYEYTAPLPITPAFNLVNSTLSGNSSNVEGGGIYAALTDLNAVHSPITLSNSILANSTGSDCGTTPPAEVTADATSIIEDGTCNTSALTTDPLLGNLANNGGHTFTHLPLAGSPAIDAGDNTGCGSDKSVSTDQRGFSRSDGACDIGAVEVQTILDGGNTIEGSSSLNPLMLLLGFLIWPFRLAGNK